MKKRPSAIWHMMRWGFTSGLILALSYIVVVADMFEAGFNPEILGIIFSPFGWYLAFLFGGLPGAAMGAIVGIALWWMMREVALPFTKAQMVAKRSRIYTVIGGLTLMFSSVLIMLFFGRGFFGSFFDFLLLGIPPIIAALASTYAAHRYMFRMRLWSGGIETHKTKAKNDALATTRLTDTVSKNEFDDNDVSAQAVSQLEQKSG